MEVAKTYDAVAAAFDRGRGPLLGEDKYLQKILAGLPQGGSVLDIGCGTGQPIARYFIERGFHVTGIDAAQAMIGISRARFPKMTWFVEDMRRLALPQKFDAIVAWDSFFHLTRDDQRAMFPIFRAHAASEAQLLFTSGPKDGEVMGKVEGQAVYHSSLSPEEYRALLTAQGFSVLQHVVEDPACGFHTVWLAQLAA